VDFVKHAFARLKAIGCTNALSPFLKKASVVADGGDVELGGDRSACIAATRYPPMGQWADAAPLAMRPHCKEAAH